MIPIIRVEYTFSQLLRACFVSSNDGKYTRQLKLKICTFFSVSDCLLTSSARCAIYMILRALPQHKVIVPAYTCEVVIEACKMAQKDVVFAHVDNIDLTQANIRR